MKILLISDKIKRIFSEDTEIAYKETQNSVIEHLENAIKGVGFEISSLLVTNNLGEEIIQYKPDLVFNRSNLEYKLEGLAYVPWLLEKHNIPFTGPNSKYSIIAFNKYLTKQLLIKNGIPTPNFIIINKQDEIVIPDSLNYPLFIKPIIGGCSLGISENNLVYNQKPFETICRKLLDEIQQPVLVEEFLPGREFTVGILGNNKPIIFPILEFGQENHSEHSFRSFNSKMVEGKKEKEICPAKLSAQQKKSIENLALKAYKTIGCQEYARLDIRFDKSSNPNLLEVNAFPTLIPGGSSYAHMAEVYGFSFPDLVREIIQSAMKRYGIEY